MTRTLSIASRRQTQVNSITLAELFRGIIAPAPPPSRFFPRRVLNAFLLKLPNDPPARFATRALLSRLVACDSVYASSCSCRIACPQVFVNMLKRKKRDNNFFSDIKIIRRRFVYSYIISHRNFSLFLSRDAGIVVYGTDSDWSTHTESSFLVLSLDAACSATASRYIPLD